MMKSLTLLLMTLIFKNQGKLSEDEKRVRDLPPPGSLRSPSGTLRGKTKTNDESFIQNIQLSPVLMHPSQKPLRDISCFKDFRTFKVKITKAKSQRRLSAFGNRNTLLASLWGKSESASLAFSYKSTKDERLKNQRRLSAFGKISLQMPFGASPNERLASLGDKNTKDERLKGQGHLNAFGHTGLFIALGISPDERLASLGDINLKDEKI
jgi:hypothetical protein